MPTTPIRKIRIQTPGSETPIEVPIGAYAEDILMSKAAGADDLVTELDKKLEASDLPSDFTGASSSAAGVHGLVPAPAVGDENKFLQGDGTWAAIAGGVTSVNGKTGAVTLAASDIGAVSTSVVGQASGIAELDANGKVPSAQLPSYVDDVIEGYYNTTDGKFYKESTYTTEITGETDKIYVSLDTNKSYRWGGSAFVEISASLALGETDSTAYRGDRGKAAYDHATESGKVSSAISAGFYKVGVTAEGHISTAEAVTKSDLTALGVSALENVVDGPANIHSVIEGAVSSGTHEGNPYTANIADGAFSHAEGVQTSTHGLASHAEGWGTLANGDYSHAEGSETIASGDSSHTEGVGTTASGEVSHAEGWLTSASGDKSHAEGNETTASGDDSHAESAFTLASGNHSHTEGYYTLASADDSHAEGFYTTASGESSHAQGSYTIAQGKNQTVIGKFNIAQGTPTSVDATDYAFIIGNGTTDNARSNAFGIKWNGNFVLSDGTELTPAQIASEGKEYEAVTGSVGSASGWNAGSITNASVSGDTLTFTLGTAPSLTVTSTTVATNIQEKTTP